MAKHLFKKESHDDVHILTLVPANIDQANVDDLLEAMMFELEKADQPDFLIDFSSVQYISSIVLGNFVVFRRRVEDAGGTLKMCNLSPVLQSLFRITKLDHLFSIHENRQKALERF